ncbi:LrgB family protein [Paenibacillus terrigena]|uniref:LrgB family protein n=1 Tax=Paenibacillus terrigena TaxID=369333 RepID=UPI000363D108|nr:LrgB family protein [Paenibacillus terrigena]
MLEAIFWLFITVAIYFASKRLYKAFPKVYLTPVLIVPIIVILLIQFSGVSFQSYNEGAGWLSEMVKPATIALAVMLYKHVDVLKKNVTAIIVSVGAGAIIAIITSAGIAKMLGLTKEITDSVAPRSTTTPIAVSVSDMIGGIPTVTAVATLVTGLLGMIIGPMIVKYFRIHSSVARGALFGTSAHACGISKALEYDAVAGSVAGISMMATAFITLGLAPFIMTWF